MTILPSQVILDVNVLCEEMNSESILLNLTTENYHGLQDVGVRIWQLLQIDSNIENLIATIIREYDVKEAVFRQDLASLIEQLYTENLIDIIS